MTTVLKSTQKRQELPIWLYFIPQAVLSSFRCHVTNASFLISQAESMINRDVLTIPNTCITAHPRLLWTLTFTYKMGIMSIILCVYHTPKERLKLKIWSTVFTECTIVKSNYQKLSHSKWETICNIPSPTTTITSWWTSFILLTNLPLSQMWQVTDSSRNLGGYRFTLSQCIRWFLQIQN